MDDEQQVTQAPGTHFCPLTELLTQTRPTPYWRDGWRLVECCETGFVFLPNPPPYAVLTEEQAWERSAAREEERRRHDEPILSRLSAIVKGLRARFVRRNKFNVLALGALRDAPKGELRLLDLGCGEGRKGYLIAGEWSHGGGELRPYGIEISPVLARQAHEAFTEFGGHCLATSGVSGLERFPDDFFDLVLLASYLEHELRPRTLLSRCRDKLRPGGRVVINVPNFASWNRRVRGNRWCGFRYPDHVSYFTPATLRQLVEACGLEVVRQYGRDRLPTSDCMYLVAGRPSDGLRD